MNEPTITVYEDTPLAEIVRQLDELGLIKQPVPIVIEYRWYYNSEGRITAACSNPKDAEIYGFTDNYIVVDQKLYNELHKYMVVNGQPFLIPQDIGIRRVLQKSNLGFKTIKNNAGLLLENEELTDNTTEFYDYRNS